MLFNEPLVSVLIPAYNHENYVQETINSIINQTYQNIELIIIDDGSKDSTWQKIIELKEQCEKRFSNVIFQTKENEGTRKTLNKLLSLTKGEYIYLIASDDLAKPNAIELQANFLLNNKEYGLVVGDNEIIDEKSTICYWDKERNNVYSKDEAEFLTFGDLLQKAKGFDFKSDKFGKYETLYESNYIPNGYLIKKTVFDKIGNFTDEAPLEDYWLMLQISKYYKMKYINEVLFSYRWHNDNTIKNIEKMENYTKITRNYEDKIYSQIDKNKVFKNVLNTIKYGVCYKKFGIPFLFEISSYKKENIKTKYINFFNLKFKIKSKQISH